MQLHHHSDHMVLLYARGTYTLLPSHSPLINTCGKSLNSYTLHYSELHTNTMSKLISHSTQHIILPSCIHFSKYCSIPILFTFFIPPTSNHFPHTFCRRHIQVLFSKNSKPGSTVDTFEEMPYALSALQEGYNLRTSKYYKHPQNYK